MRLLCYCATVLFCASSLLAEAPKKCFSCRQVIKGKYLLLESGTLPVRREVCTECRDLKTRCYTCGLPVKVGFTELEDGRLLCYEDAPSAVTLVQEAKETFQDVKRDLVAMLYRYGSAPDRNVELTLVSVPELAKATEQLRVNDHGTMAYLGLNHSVFVGNGKFEHSISVLKGLSRGQFIAVAAHEYAHAWLNENLRSDRLLDQSTKEGFCELIAYKLVSQRNLEEPKRSILANPYTKGQFEILLRADTGYQFHRVVDWFKRGTDSSLTASNTARLLQLEDQAVAQLSWPGQVPIKIAETLLLKGISGTPRRRFALINDRTFARNEIANVRVGSSNVLVHCLEIKDRSVTVALGEDAKKEELFLRNN